MNDVMMMKKKKVLVCQVDGVGRLLSDPYRRIGDRM